MKYTLRQRFWQWTMRYAAPRSGLQRFHWRPDIEDEPTFTWTPSDTITTSSTGTKITWSK